MEYGLWDKDNRKKHFLPPALAGEIRLTKSIPASFSGFIHYQSKAEQPLANTLQTFPPEAGPPLADNFINFKTLVLWHII